MMITIHNLKSMALYAEQHGAELMLHPLGLQLTMHKGDAISRRYINWESLDMFYPMDSVAGHVKAMMEELTS